MKVITWNVNSLRTRLGRVLGVLERHEPDVLCLQETKLADEDLPREEIERRGYHVASFGQSGGLNGVALISREPAADVQRGFDANPVPDEARVISASFDGVRIIDIYVINGQSLDSDKYRLKLDWLDTLRRYIERFHQPNQPLVVCGDFNIAPDDRDVYKPQLWHGRVLCSAEERSRLQAMVDWGLTDLLRAETDDEGIYSWWDYRYGAFRRNQGLRIDLVLATGPLVERCTGVKIDRYERSNEAGPGKPSDHAPVVATFE